MSSSTRTWSVALLLLAALFLAAELILRVLSGYNTNWDVRLGASKQFDPVTHFRNKPHYDLGKGLVTNELGYHAPMNLAREVPADALRVLYLGDSNSVTPRHENYPKQVEDLLRRELAIRVETVNAAVPGFSSENARLLFESELSHFDGDWFVVNLGWNDLGQYGPEGLHFKRRQAGYELSPAQRFLSEVYTARFLFAGLSVLRQLRPAVSRAMTSAELALYQSYEPTHFYENLHAILKLAKSRYPHVLLINIATLTNDDPTPDELRRAHFPTGMDKNMTKLHYLVLQYRKAIEEVGREEGVTVVDLYPLFDSHDARLLFTDSAHMNRAGAAKVARAVTDAIEAGERAQPTQPRAARAAGSAR